LLSSPQNGGRGGAAAYLRGVEALILNFAIRRVLILEGVEGANSRICGGFEPPILFWYTDSEIKSGYHHLEVQNFFKKCHYKISISQKCMYL